MHVIMIIADRRVITCMPPVSRHYATLRCRLLLASGLSPPVLLRPFGAVFLCVRALPPVSPGVIDIASFQDASGLKPAKPPGT